MFGSERTERAVSPPALRCPRLSHLRQELQEPEEPLGPPEALLRRHGRLPGRSAAGSAETGRGEPQFCRRRQRTVSASL